MLYCFDINRRIFVDNDSHFRATPPAGRPSFFAGDTITLILQPVSDAEFFTFPAGTIFTVAIDNNFLPDDVLMAAAECELYAGKIQVTLNCNTESFIAKVSTRNTAAIIEIVAYEPGDTQGKTILQTDILCSPRISTQATPPAVVTPEYLTAAETRALVGAVDIKLGGAQLADVFDITSADTFPTCKQIAEYLAEYFAGVTLNEVLPESIDLTGSATVVREAQFSAQVLPSGANQSVSWSSSSTDIATVADGLVTVVASGTCTITATSTRNPAVSASINITCSL